jgi:hypothetical protein
MCEASFVCLNPAIHRVEAKHHRCAKFPRSKAVWYFPFIFHLDGRAE